MKRWNVLFAELIILLACHTSFAQKNRSLIDFFLPMKPQSPLVSDGIWGDESVLPRDTANGLEGKSIYDPGKGKYLVKDWCYWDGNITKSDDGKYHMYASRWPQSMPHGIGWTKGSVGVHAVSNSLLGPYKDLGLTWSQWKNGKGTNVVGVRLTDGRYALITSEIVPGQVFVSDNPNGPFELLGEFKIDANGYYPGWGRYNELDDGAVRGGSVGFLSNVMIITRPDGRYMMIARHCVPMISDNGILGPYKMMNDKAWRNVEGIPQFKMEDPTVWYSDSLYHIVVNFHGADSTFHLTSEDGMHNWKNRGLAFHRGAEVFHHPDGTIENWHTVQRMTVYKEDDIVKAFNFSVIDVHKGQDAANDENGSKIVVVPFNGKAFGKHIRQIVDEENRISDATPPPAPWQSSDVGKVSKKGNTGYDKIVNTIRMKACGNKIDGQDDAFHFTWQKMSGDVSAKVFLLTDEISGGPLQSGLMMRKSLDADAPFVFVSFAKDGGFLLKKRNAKGQTVSVLTRKDLKTPYWVRLEKRGGTITCYTSVSNRMNWELMGETDLHLRDDFYVGMASTSNGGANATLARFKDVDVHVYGNPKTEGIVRHTFPDTIPASGIINFEAEIESKQTLDVWVELENVQSGEKYKVLRQRYWKNGMQELKYDAGKPLNPDNTYWFVIKAVPMHFHDCERVQSGFKKVFVKK